jgi:hypothetical protein
MSTKINLHEMLGKQDTEKVDKWLTSTAHPSQSFRSDYMAYGFKAGYNAALNDLQGKVDGLLNSLIKISNLGWYAGTPTKEISDYLIKQAGMRGPEIAMEALAEFKKDSE